MHVYKDTLNNIKLQAHEQHNPEYQPIIFFYNFVKKKLLQQKKACYFLILKDFLNLRVSQALTVTRVSNLF